MSEENSEGDDDLNGLEDVMFVIAVPVDKHLDFLKDWKKFAGFDAKRHISAKTINVSSPIEYEVTGRFLIKYPDWKPYKCAR